MKAPLKFLGVTQGFKKGVHNGIDLGWNSSKGGKNAPISAVEDGVVISVQYQKTGGNVLQILHNGFVSEYGHCSKIVVTQGQKVTKGQYVANMGNTGSQNGKPVPYHLHFGICLGNEITYTSKDKWVNPIEYLCVFKDQTIANGSKNLKWNYTKIVTGVPSEPLNIRDSKNKVVGGLYNGNEIEYYGKKLLSSKCIVDKVNQYTTYDKYLK